MTTNPDIQRNPESALRAAEERWRILAEQVPANHPRYPEFLRIHTEATTVLQRCMLSLNMRAGWPVIERDMEHLTQLYQRATEIRMSAIPTAIRQGMQLPAGQTVEDNLTQTFNQTGENREWQSLIRDLTRIASGLDCNPQETPQNGGFQFYKNGGQQVNFANVNAARAILTRINATPALLAARPDIAQMVERLETGLTQLESIDPVRSSGNQLNNYLAQVTQVHDYRALRFMGVLGGGLIGGGALLYSLIGGRELSWPIGLWLGIAAVSLRPDLMAGGTEQAISRFQNVYTPEAEDAIRAGMQGEGGALAFDELQQIRSENGRLVETLTSATTISDAQVGQLMGGATNTPLGQLLMGLNPSERPAILQGFGRRITGLEEVTARELIRTRPQIRMA